MKIAREIRVKGKTKKTIMALVFRWSVVAIVVWVIIAIGGLTLSLFAVDGFMNKRYFNCNKFQPFNSFDEEKVSVGHDAGNIFCKDSMELFYKSYYKPASNVGTFIWSLIFFIVINGAFNVIGYGVYEQIKIKY